MPHRFGQGTRIAIFAPAVFGHAHDLLIGTVIYLSAAWLLAWLGSISGWTGLQTLRATPVGKEMTAALDQGDCGLFHIWRKCLVLNKVQPLRPSAP